jgi:hypothetical protein
MPSTPITITVRQIKHITTNNRGPIANPFHAIECDGLPDDDSGRRITSFSLFPNSNDDLKPGSFEIGHTYKIIGNVNGQYYRVQQLLAEVTDPVPGEAGVPEPRRYDGGGTQRQTALKEAAALYSQGVTAEQMPEVLLLADLLDGWLRQPPA